jgi:hypothetical protein
MNSPASYMLKRKEYIMRSFHIGPKFSRTTSLRPHKNLSLVSLPLGISNLNKRHNLTVQPTTSFLGRNLRGYARRSLAAPHRKDCKTRSAHPARMHSRTRQHLKIRNQSSFLKPTTDSGNGPRPVETSNYSIRSSCCDDWED